MPKARVLIVDDSVVVRKIVSEVIGRYPEFEVVGVAPNGRIALQKLVQVTPDVIILDIEMPEMNGLETVREIRKTHKRIPVFMFSNVTTRGAAATLEALAEGATDYVTKPANTGNLNEAIAHIEEFLIPKLKDHCSHLKNSKSGGGTLASRGNPILQTKLRPSFKRLRPPSVLCIGSSTGGPNALADVFQGIKTRFPVPVFIVQHMPPTFTRMLAERLDRLSPNRCYEAQENQLVRSGEVYIAPGGKHMVARRAGGTVRIHLNEDPPEHSCRPAVDVLFRSMAESYNGDVLAVILTGMGKDGLYGSEAIVERGGSVIAQDEASSVVWGMPGAVAKAGIAEQILPLPEIPEAINERFRSGVMA